MKTESPIVCKDLYNDAAEILKGLDSDIDKTVQDLAKDVEARGVPRNKVARQVVKELTARGVLSSSRIYKALGIEQKRKYEKREIEETFPQVENISTEESSTNKQAVQLVVTGTGQSETLKDMNEEQDMKLVSEEQKQIGAPRQENESLKGKGKAESELKETAYLRKENAGLKSKIEELERQLAEKTEQISGLRKDYESLEKKHQLELLQMAQTKVYDMPGIINVKNIQNTSINEVKYFELGLKKLNTNIQEDIESNRQVSLRLYATIKHETKLIPVRVDYNKGRIYVSLWRKKLQIPSPSASVSSDVPRTASDCANPSMSSVTQGQGKRLRAEF